MSKKKDIAPDQLLKPDANIGSWAEEDDDFGLEGNAFWPAWGVTFHHTSVSGHPMRMRMVATSRPLASAAFILNFLVICISIFCVFVGS